MNTADAAAAAALSALFQLVVDVSCAVVGGNYEHTLLHTSVQGDFPLPSLAGSHAERPSTHLVAEPARTTAPALAL
jgi:hypothetical protein